MGGGNRWQSEKARKYSDLCLEDRDSQEVIPLMFGASLPGRREGSRLQDVGFWDGLEGLMLSLIHISEPTRH